MNLDQVICVCSRPDAKVWSIAAPRILKFIDSKRYLLIVPDADVGFFGEISPSTYSVIPETFLAPGVLEKILRMLPDDQKHRSGWYLQQFLKLKAIERLKNTDLGLIWDADTVPLRKMHFFDPEGESANLPVVRYYEGTQIHLPYFQVAKKLLGMTPSRRGSFIAQCMPVRGHWVNSFISHIENAHQMRWEDAILDCIDFKVNSGFSEYETLGIFFSNHYPSEFLPSGRGWHRFGGERIGGIDNLDDPRAELMLRRYDYVSFEKWEKRWSPLRRLQWNLLPAHKKAS